MKFLEKISLTIFAVIILFLNLLLCLIIFNWIKVSSILYVVQFAILNSTISRIMLFVAIILMLLAIKCIFFATDKNREQKTEGILLENESGKLLISVDTIENLVKTVINGFTSIKSASCKVNLDKQVNNICISLNLIVSADIVIKELSLNLQNRIKEVVKNATDIEVKQINIKIKNIETPKEQ